MATPDEMRAALAEARAEFRAALESIDSGWETAPSSGEGEAAWSPRQTAEHAIGAEAWFTTTLCEACGYPGVDKVEANYPTPQAAIEAFDAVVEACNKKLKYVTDTDLEKTHERMGNVENVMRENAKHMRDHAEQIRSAVGVA